MPDIIVSVQGRLRRAGLIWENCVADTGYSSGENYAFLEGRNLKSFIPPHGTYKGCPDGFTYHQAENHYLCPQGKIIPFKKVFYQTKNHTKKEAYRASKKLCTGCPICRECLGKSAQEKKFTVTYYREEYERHSPSK